MKRFIKEYDGKGIEDCGSYTSKEFDSFSRKFKNALKRSISNDCRIINYSKGHYYISTFIEYHNHYLYLMFYVPRGGYPINFTKFNYSDGICYRIAKNEKDYQGESNRWCTMAELPDAIKDIIEKWDAEIFIKEHFIVAVA